jgi:hypothetical protein
MKKTLAEIISDELFVQCTHSNGMLTIERLPIVDREPGDDGMRYYGKIDISALASAIDRSGFGQRKK